jgi:glycosyltransferase involved in cell wall biosynthesis
MGYLCKYLRHYGWTPTVIAEHVEDDMAFESLRGDTITFVRFYPAQKRTRKLVWPLIFTADLLFGYKNRRMYRTACRVTRQKSFQVILCSTFRTFPLPAALHLAKKINLPLVVDLRDIIEQFAGNEIIAHRLPHLCGLDKYIVRMFKWDSLRRRNRVLQAANHVTTISPWHVEVLRRINPHVSLIYNGYDPELFYPSPVAAPQFFITYTGRLFNTTLRDPDLLFRAVTRLHTEGIITPERFRIRWYTDRPAHRILQQAAEAYPISEYMDYRCYVPSAEIPKLLNESAILLLLANAASSGNRGIMTTKLFEYLAVERPILCVRSDESYLAQALQESGSGLAAVDADEVYLFLKTYYHQWLSTGKTTVHTASKILNRYSRKEQAGMFAEIFNQLSR